MRRTSIHFAFLLYGRWKSFSLGVRIKWSVVILPTFSRVDWDQCLPACRHSWVCATTCAVCELMLGRLLRQHGLCHISLECPHIASRCFIRANVCRWIDYVECDFCITCQTSKVWMQQDEWENRYCSSSEIAIISLVLFLLSSWCMRFQNPRAVACGSITFYV